MPFKFEGEKRFQIAKESLEKIKPNLNAFVVIPNEKIFQIIKENTPFKEALSAVNQILAQSLKGLIETIYTPGLINIDFADLKTILEKKGKLAYLSSVETKGENRTEEALKKVLNCPLIDYNIKDAQRILFNITSSKNLGMLETAYISKTISDFNKSAKIIFGISESKKYDNKIRITLLAVGCREKERENKVYEKKSVVKERRKITENETGKTAKKIKKKPKKVKSKKEFSSMKTSKKAKEKIKTDNQATNEISSASSISAESSPSKTKKIRRSALELKEEIEKAEKEILEEEKKWEIPAFLRKKKINP